MTENNRGPGETLRAEREALGVTVREVADTLNLSMQVVQALESDDYKRLPGAVFARGYIRAYARLLDLDPEPLLALYPGQTNGGDASHPVVHEQGIAEWIRRRPGLVLTTLALLVVALLAGLAALIWPEEGIDSLWNRTESPAVIVPPRDAAADWDWSPAESDTSAAATAAVSAEPDGQEGLEAAVPGASGAPAEGAPAIVVEGVAEQPLGVAPDSVARRITDTGEQRLAMQFADDSWVEVRNANGRVLYSNLNRAGTALELVGQGPFRILLGYAPGVTLTFDGEQIALGPHTRNNVATLVLGQ